MGKQVPGYIKRCLFAAQAVLIYYTNSIKVLPHDGHDTSHLVATKSGLFLINTTSWQKVMAGEFYGIALRGGTAHVFQSINSKGRILRLRLDGHRIRSAGVVIRGLSSGCHQIDHDENDLLVTDTYNNRVLRFDGQYRQIGEYYPIGRLDNGRTSANYGHINSVAAHNGGFSLVAHNETKKTGRNSQVLKCDAEFNVIRTIDLDAGAAHNIAFLDDGYLVCDSLGNRVIDQDNCPVIKVDQFTRGLSVESNQIVLGGSMYASREQRRDVRGSVYFFDREYHPLATLPLPAMVQEIRKLP